MADVDTLEQPPQLSTDDQPSAAKVSPQPPVDDKKPEQSDSQKAAVKQWCAKIKKDKKHWSPDFDRMRDNQKFAAGQQWPNQMTIKDDRYVCNLTLRMVQQKVASLYARNPESTVQRKQKIDHTLWDGHQQSLVQAGMAVQVHMHAAAMGIRTPPPLEAMALLKDYQQVKQRRDIVDKVCKTVMLVTQHQIDMSRPVFKDQMKGAVERTVICGVSYVVPYFCRDDEGLNIVQYQDGRRFEIRWIQGGPIGRNYEILRELKSYAA